MTEVLHTPRGPERGEPLELSQEIQKARERVHEQAEAWEQRTDQQIEKLRAEVQTEAVSGKEVTIGEREGHHDTPIGVKQQLKAHAYKAGLRHIQRRLKGPERRFSKVIHAPGVERISAAAGHTVARPSGLLGGGAGALLGSLILLYTSKHYGFTYNYGAFLLLFIAGFAIGSLLEIALHIKRRTAR